jgi:transposase
MAKIEKKTKRYPCDLTDEEWSAAEVFLSLAHSTGRRRQTNLREILNAIPYMVCSGCEWRVPLIHFPQTRH